MYMKTTEFDVKKYGFNKLVSNLFEVDDYFS